MTMTLDEAIKTLALHANGYKKPPDPNLVPAMWLGIEGLKRLQDIRHTIYSDLQSPLPGETE